jgi:hypothetical protein
MAEIPEFFIPGVQLGKEEEKYAEFAKRYECKVQDFNQRIYSIEYRHDGWDWTAAVGQTLSATIIHTEGKRGQRRTVQDCDNDPATVLAIFAGDPTFKVVTDRFQTRFADPLHVGIADCARVTYFSTRKSRAATA